MLLPLLIASEIHAAIFPIHNNMLYISLYIYLDEFTLYKCPYLDLPHPTDVWKSYQSLWTPSITYGAQDHCKLELSILSREV